MKEEFNGLLKKEMSRREFLSVIGYSLASVVGIGSLLRLLGHKGLGGYTAKGNGYGNSPYGK